MAILLLASAATAAFAQSPTATVDLVDLNNTVAMHAKVAGVDALLIIDTGSYELRLRSGFARQANLKLRTTAGTSYGTAEVRVGSLVDPKAKIIVQEEAPLPFEGDATKAKVDGIIGLSFLQSHALGLDLVSHRVSLWQGGHVDPKQAALWIGAAGPAPTTSLRGTPAAGDWYKVRTEVEGKPLDFVLDTGSTWTTIAPRYAKTMRLTRVGSVPAFSFNGTSAVSACIAKAVQFGPVALSDQVVAVDGADADYDGLLGLQSLRNCRVILDFPAQQAMISRVSTFVKPQHDSPLVSIGIDLMRLSDDRLMAIVATGSPAEKAGVRTGDILVSLNGRPADELIVLMKENTREDSVAAWSAALMRKSYALVMRTPEGSTKRLSLQRG